MDNVFFLFCFVLFCAVLDLDHVGQKCSANSLLYLIFWFQVPFESLEVLQRVNMNENRLKTLDGLVSHPLLEDLSVECKYFNLTYKTCAIKCTIIFFCKETKVPRRKCLLNVM